MTNKSIAKTWMENNLGTNSDFKIAYVDCGNYGGAWVRTFFTYKDGINYARISLKIVHGEVVANYPKSYGPIDIFDVRIDPLFLFQNPELGNKNLLNSITADANWIKNEDLRIHQEYRDSNPLKNKKAHRKKLQGINLGATIHRLMCDYLNINAASYYYFY